MWISLEFYVIYEENIIALFCKNKTKQTEKPEKN